MAEVVNMMYGKFNPDRFCSVLEKILSERDENIKVKVSLVAKKESNKDEKGDNGTA